MTILQPATQPRRNPVGRHKCGRCGTLFVLDADDVAKLKPTSEGHLLFPCPGACGAGIIVNWFGEQEPPAP